MDSIGRRDTSDDCDDPEPLTVAILLVMLLCWRLDSIDRFSANLKIGFSQVLEERDAIRPYRKSYRATGDAR